MVKGRISFVNFFFSCISKNFRISFDWMGWGYMFVFELIIVVWGLEYVDWLGLGYMFVFAGGGLVLFRS